MKNPLENEEKQFGEYQNRKLSDLLPHYKVEQFNELTDTSWDEDLAFVSSEQDMLDCEKEQEMLKEQEMRVWGAQGNPVNEEPVFKKQRV